MADKTISDLIAATEVHPLDLFVLEQSSTAKKLTGQILENWLLQLAEGHGGIVSIVKTGTSGLVDTYTITMSDASTVTFTVTNGRAISTITTYYAVSTSGTTVPSSWSTTRQSMTAINRYLWSYQHIAFNNSTSVDTEKTVIGVWGDKGDTGETGRGIEEISQTSRIPGDYTVYTCVMTDGTTETFYSYDGNGIVSIEKTATAGLEDTYTIRYTNNTTSTLVVTNAKSIVSIEKITSSGVTDTYRISFNDGTYTLYYVENGVGIVGIQKTATAGLIDTYTVTLNNGNTTTFTVTNAKSIVSVTQIGGTHAAGTNDTFRILFNDGDTVDFNVYNGSNGSGSVSRVDGVEPVNQNVQLLVFGNGAPTPTTAGQVKSRYFDTSSGILYICVGVDTSGGEDTYSWIGTGVPVDSALSTVSTNPVQNRVLTNIIGTGSVIIGNTLIGAVNSIYSSKAERIIISGTYNSDATYAVGDCCIRAVANTYRLYRCIVAIETPEAWTAGHWTETTVAIELAKKYEKPSGGIPDADIASAATWNAKGTYSKPAGGIPKSDLASAVQTSLGKADSAYQKPSGGILKTDLASGVQTSLGKADTALQSVPSTYRTAAAQDVIDANNMALGLTGAAVGDLVRVAAVDANGKPTSWNHVPLCNIVTNKNLLDNWYFVGGGSQQGGGQFPVNQRGDVISIGIGTYAIDRWFLAGTSPTSEIVNTANEKGIKLSRSETGDTFLVERFEQGFTQSLAGQEVTISAKFSGHTTGSFILYASQRDTSTSLGVRAETTETGGVVSATGILPADMSNGVSFRLVQRGVGTTIIEAVKLELGSEQTLAHQEGGVWVLNEIPDYEDTLFNCLHSTADSSDPYANRSLTPKDVSVTANSEYFDGWYASGNLINGNQLHIGGALKFKSGVSTIPMGALLISTNFSKTKWSYGVIMQVGKAIPCNFKTDGKIYLGNVSSINVSDGTCFIIIDTFI